MKFLREPLVQFILIGAALFGLFSATGKWTAGDLTTSHIVLTPGLIENLKVSYERQSGHPPNLEQVKELIDEYVHEEILCREARSIGIDRDDTIVRTVLRERMEYLAEGAASIAEPSGDELQTYFLAHQNEFKLSDGKIPELAAIRPDVLSSWQNQQRKTAAKAAYNKIRERYRVTVQLPPERKNP